MSSKKILANSFLFIAILALIFAIICFNADCGDLESNKAYGGDAYTGIQNSSAQTANNIYYLNKNISKLG